MSKWKKVRIGEFLFERKGRYKPDDKALSGLKRLEKIDFSGRFYIADKPSNTGMILIKPGDFVISGINVSKGAMGIYAGTENITATIHYSSYTFDKKNLNVEYFKRFLKSTEFVRLLKEQVKGGIKTEIKPKHLLSLEINLPDIETQNLIVKHFQSCEDEISDLYSEITHQQTLLKKLRQSILQEAIEGKLTVNWRKKNPNAEPASELLKKIKTEKEKLIAEGKIKKQKPLPEIKEDEKPFDLPERWVWTRLIDIIYENPRNGYSAKPVDFPTKTKTLKLGATTSGFFIDSEIKYINEDIPLDSYLWLEPGDILIQRSNSIDYVGISAIFEGKSHEFIYPDLMMKIKPSGYIVKKYLHKALLSTSIREYFKSHASGAQKSMPKINQGIVSSTLIPLPPLVEQKAIVRKVENILTYYDQLEKQINSSKENNEQLVQAVLKEAFEE